MNIDSTKLLYQIALTQIEGVGDILARNLIDTIGSPEEIFTSAKKTLITVKGISTYLADAVLNSKVLERAEKELLFVQKNNIQTYFYTDSDYCNRLKECIDAPILLYYKGKADLNATKIVSIVGTRKSTNYGNDFCEEFLEDLSSAFPNILIVSGLAYGIDIQAHKSALKHNLPTVGVLAHGLDRIYPSGHRKTAVEMLERGGLLTEFPSETEPDRFNFVRRNRIVAGMSDATIVVQSDSKGGSLITAEMANSYNRDVFSLPGRVTDKESVGCNMLIEDNRAILLQSADSFIKHMQWDVNKQISKPKQRQLFLDLSDDEQAVYDLLAATESLHINLIANQIGIPVSNLLSTLLTMEMKGIVRTIPGGSYQLL
ncbi:DNA processing protein [Dysgonomonas alginatilytica]|uniref:DNA processing protein n=1 Tax=Dysgonomonas alginatilytica TaxID=1605892 RepID=A0A2V3PM09_9BACT|nr:DNA-processing protein DprA [Dysgonomonas alginatilytica]PXV60939.1 DNA processing protein [Dysgonomonas alginatilytica]